MPEKITLDATGETMTFVKTGADTDGEFVEVLVTLPATGEGPPPHRHVLQTELFEAIDGRLGLTCDGEKMVLEPGQSFTVPKNTPHTCYSVDGDAIRFRAVFKPALHIQYMLTEIFAACNRKGSKDPSPFEGAYVLGQVRGEYYLSDVPEGVQNYIFPMVGALGKLLGLVKARAR